MADHTPLTARIATAVALARQASDLALTSFHAGVRSWTKPDASSLSEADLAIDALLVSGLLAAFPADAVLSEERNDDPARLQAELTWIIDPIDGTREFVEKIPEFAVMIALVRHGQPLWGLVADPTRARLLHGGPGLGCHLLDFASGTSLKLQADSALPGVERFLASRSRPSPDVEGAIVSSGHRLLRMGSAGLKFNSLCRSQAEHYPYLKDIREWDVAPGDAILRGAGGLTVDLNGRPLTYNHQDTLLHGFIASRSPAALPGLIERFAPFYTP